MKKVYEIFFSADGTRPVLVLLALLLAAVCEAVGISALLPAATLLGGSGPGTSSVEETLRGGLAMVGLQPTLGAILGLIMVAMILKSIISFLALTYAGFSAAKVSVRMRERLVEALFGANWRFYSDRHGGDFANAVSNDATRAGEAYMLAAQFASLSVQMVIYTLVALLMDWRVAIIGSVFGLAMALSMSFLIRRSRRAGKKQTDRTNRLTVQVVDMLANIKPLKTMHRYAELQDYLHRTMDQLRNSLRMKEVSRQAMIQGGDAITAVAVGLVIYVSNALWQVPLAQLLVGGVILLRVVQNVTKFQRLLQQSVEVESTYQRLSELVELAERNQERHAGRTPPDTHAGLRFENVSFSYGQKPVLTGVSIEVPAKGITVLKGPSGAGKTTIVDLMIGLHQPSSGRILLGATPLAEVDIVSFRRKIGYVPQEISLMHASIRDNITLGDKAISDAEVVSAIEQAGGAGFLAGLAEGLDTDVGEMGGKLSGGQRQRISLARALAGRPDILILDEVTSALDPSTEAEIVRNIAGLSRRYTMIIITHREAWAEIADRLYEVKDGTAAEIPAPAASDIRDTRVEQSV